MARNSKRAYRIAFFFTCSIVFLFVSVSASVFDPETVTIHDQVWMLRNYHPSMFSSAPKIKGVAYNYRTTIATMYGNLLTYEEAVAACPSGWHLPSMEEWNALFEAVGGMEVAGGHLKTVEYWRLPNTGADNSSGFSALPAGGSDETYWFDGFGWATHFWSSTLKDGKVLCPSMKYDVASVYILELPPKMRLSVRYIQDKPAEKPATQDFIIPLGKSIVADGKIDEREWIDAKKIEIMITGRKNVEIYIKHDQANLLLLFELYNPDEKSILFPEILIDPNLDQSDSWLVDDWWFHVSGSDCASNGKAGDYSGCRIVQYDWTAVPNYPINKPGIVNTIEIIIPLSKPNITQGKAFGFAVLVSDINEMGKYWPETATIQQPSTWRLAILE